jgi:hypothetical protein
MLHDQVLAWLEQRLLARLENETPPTKKQKGTCVYLMEDGSFNE